MSRRSGFSLVECLVAAALLAGGLLALSAAGRATQLLDLFGARAALAAEAAASRLAALRAAGCSAVSGGATGVVDERWTVVAAPPLVMVTVDVAWTAGNRRRVVRYDGGWRCRP